MTSEPGAPAVAFADPPGWVEQAFPVIAPEAVTRLSAYGAVETLQAGDPIFRRGDPMHDLLLIRKGTVEVFEDDEDGAPRIIVALGPRQFLGELDLINGRPTLVSSRASSRVELVRIGTEDFRRMAGIETDLAEIMIGAFILRRAGLVRRGAGGVTVVGSGHQSDTLRLKAFLTRNAYPHQVIDTDLDPGAHGLVVRLAITAEQLPALIVPGGLVIRNPTNAAVADALGLSVVADAGHLYDVVVVGAGPGGLASAVYAASEGLDTLVIEGLAPGGQAGTSSRIENYLGFPTGISGGLLAAQAEAQAEKFGARFAIARTAIGLNCDEHPYRVALDDGREITTRSIIIAAGARYRRLALAECARFDGQGIYYAATGVEAQFCAGQEVVVVGGGNSAGQAALFLSRLATHVHLVVRAGGLAATMSDYLTRRILSSPRITLRTRTELTALQGDTYLRAVTWRSGSENATETRPVGSVFVMIGADPNSDWLRGCVELDRAGFVRTGPTVAGATASPYQTSLPGVFAVGDIRSGSVKRVASAVGEGSIVVQELHRFLHPELA